MRLYQCSCGDSVFRHASSCTFVSCPFHPFISTFLFGGFRFLNCLSWFSMISLFFYLNRIMKESNFLFIKPPSSGNFRSEVYQFFLVNSWNKFVIAKRQTYRFWALGMWCCVSGLVFTLFRREVVPVSSRFARDLKGSYFFPGTNAVTFYEPSSYVIVHTLLCHYDYWLGEWLYSEN